MWICKNCDTKNEEKDMFCACCGEKKPVSTETNHNNQQYKTQQYNSNAQSSAFASAARETQSSVDSNIKEKSSQERAKERRNARILALFIAFLAVGLEVWIAKVENNAFDLEYLRNRIIFAVIPFLCCGFLFFSRQTILVGIADFLLGIYTFFEVIFFVFYSFMSITGNSPSTLIMVITIFLVAPVLGVYAAKGVSLAERE